MPALENSESQHRAPAPALPGRLRLLKYMEGTGPARHAAVLAALAALGALAVVVVESTLTPSSLSTCVIASAWGVGLGTLAIAAAVALRATTAAFARRADAAGRAVGVFAVFLGALALVGCMLRGGPTHASVASTAGPLDALPTDALVLVLAGLSAALVPASFARPVLPAAVSRGRARVGSWLATAAFLVALLHATASALGAPSSPADAFTPGAAALLLDVALLAASLGALALLGPAGPIHRASRRTAGGTVLRLFVPVSILLPLALGAARLGGEKAGLFGSVQGVAFMVTATVGMLLVGVQVGADALDRGEKVRRRLERRTAGLAAALECAADDVLFLDEDARVRSADPPAARLLGRGASSRAGMRWEDLLLPRETGRARAAFARAMRDGYAETEVCAPGPDGEVVEARVQLVRTEKAPGESAGCFAYLRDVSAPRRAERALKESERRLRDVAQNLAEVVFLQDATRTRVLYVNPVYECVFGRPCEELLRERWSFLKALHEDDRDRYEAELRAYEGAGRFEGRFRVRRPDGAVRQIRSHIVPVRDEHGKPRAYVGVAMDVTAEHDASEALRRSEDGLRQAQKMEAVGRLAGGIAHDFNNLLTVINGYADLALHRDGLESSARNALEQIRAAGGTAGALTSQLLTFSRRDAVTATTLDLGAVVRETDGLVRRLVGEAVEVEILHEGPRAFIRADRTQVQQVLFNLAANSRDAMPKGGRLTIATRIMAAPRTPPEGGPESVAGEWPRVELLVSDTGVGMDHDTISHLFEPFFTTKERGRGTGLGLATVHGIVTRAGGTVSVTSEPWNGTTFRVLLPLAPGTDGSETAPPDSPAPRARGTERVLVVEDNDSLRSLATEVLRGAGFRVFSAASGDEAWRIVEQAQVRIDLVLTDLRLPGLSGRDLAARLSGRRADVRVMFMSGSPLAEGEVPGGDTGVVFLPKPYTPTALLARVRDILDAPWPRRAPSSRDAAPPAPR